jgi:transglutaminase-like putative cysteine protease
LMRSCLAVLLLVGGLGWWAAKRAKDDLPVAKGARKAGLRDYLALGAGILALECGFLWLLSAAPRPLEEVAILIEAKLQPGAAAERTGNGSAENAGNWLWNDEKRRALPQRTNLKPGSKPEVFLKLPRAEDAGRLLERKVYVRAFALDDYEDGVWSLGGDEPRNLEADETGWIGLAERGEGEILHEVFHGKEGGGRDVLTALQGVRAVRLPSLQGVADGMGFLPDAGGAAGYSYLASSLPVALEDLGKGQDWGGGKPVAAAGRFGALAAKAAGGGDVLRKLLNIQSFVRNNYGYSLVTVNRDDLDPLENFLFAEKRGHCEFFATAGALMARELGVEARVAYGWAGGEYFADSRMFVFRAREAHAWVEVKMKGVWVVMEPTPPVALGGGGAPRLAEAGEKPPLAEEEAADEREETADEGEETEKTALALMAVFAAVAAVVFLFRAGRRGEALPGSHGFPGRESGGGYFALWRRACEKKGIAGRAGWTLKRQIREMEMPPAFTEELRGYHYALRYEGKALDKEKEARLKGEIKGWAAGEER